jgi:hypothetical protein
MKGLGFGGTKEKSMSTNVTFVKEKYMADLASSSKEGKTTNGDENTLPLHPSCGGLLRFGYLGKWSPCVCESLNTKGETITLVLYLYVLISL